VSDASEDAMAIPNPIKLSPMKVPKASDVLAHELRERILTGEFVEGVGLPAERELVAQTGMSRTTVREALRILEVQGLIRIKAGRTGGAFVQQPGEEVMANTVGLLVRGHRIRLAALLETREAIEPFCARLAAVHRTDEDLTILETLNRQAAEAGDDLTAFLEANVEWHIAVARAGRNELLTGLMVGLSRAIYAATADESFVDSAVRNFAVLAHEGVMKAIRDGDGDTAFRRMTRHLHEYAVAARQSGGRDNIDVF
jgi:GntR family transcriptional regulator, transcriptional repressor for pyruvate dehydrogenase complex